MCQALGLVIQYMTSLNLYSHLVKLVLIGFIFSGEETEVLRVTWPWPAAPGPLEGVSRLPVLLPS